LDGKRMKKEIRSEREWNVRLFERKKREKESKENL